MLFSCLSSIKKNNLQNFFNSVILFLWKWYYHKGFKQNFFQIIFVVLEYRPFLKGPYKNTGLNITSIELKSQWDCTLSCC